MLTKIRDNVYISKFVEYNDRPSLGYISGSRAALMVDAGNSPAHAHEFLADVSALLLNAPSYVFLTHYHWDHTFGLPALKGLTSIAGTGTNDMLRQHQKYIWDIPHLDEYVADNRFSLFSRPHILIEYPGLHGIEVLTASIEFEGHMTIDLGGETCSMGRVTSPHTDECHYLLAEKAKVLFLGDANCEEVVGERWIDNREKLEQEILELDALDFITCVTGHFEPMTKEQLLCGFKNRLSTL